MPGTVSVDFQLKTREAGWGCQTFKTAVDHWNANIWKTNVVIKQPRFLISSCVTAAPQTVYWQLSLKSNISESFGVKRCGCVLHCFLCHLHPCSPLTPAVCLGLLSLCHSFFSVLLLLSHVTSNMALQTPISVCKYQLLVTLQFTRACGLFYWRCTTLYPFSYETTFFL